MCRVLAGIVRRVNVDALHLPGIAGQQSLESVQVIALDNKISASGIAARKLRHRLQKPVRHILMMLDDSFFSYPVQCRHYESFVTVLPI